MGHESFLMRLLENPKLGEDHLCINHAGWGLTNMFDGTHASETCVNGNF